MLRCRAISPYLPALAHFPRSFISFMLISVFVFVAALFFQVRRVCACASARALCVLFSKYTNLLNLSRDKRFLYTASLMTICYVQTTHGEIFLIFLDV